MCVLTAASPSSAVIIQFRSAVPHQCGGAAIRHGLARKIGPGGAPCGDARCPRHVTGRPRRRTAAAVRYTATPVACGATVRYMVARDGRGSRHSDSGRAPWPRCASRRHGGHVYQNGYTYIKMDIRGHVYRHLVQKQSDRSIESESERLLGFIVNCSAYTLK